MSIQKHHEIQEGAVNYSAEHTSEKGQDRKIARDLGGSMRFFLNLSLALIIAFPVFILFEPQNASPVSVIAYFIPVVITIVFFVAFLRLLKRIERHAAKRQNIELVSSIIWEFNKSSLIRLVTGKVETFIEEKEQNATSADPGTCCRK